MQMQRFSRTNSSSFGSFALRVTPNFALTNSFLAPTLGAFVGTIQRRTLSGFVENKVYFDFEKKVRFGWRPGEVNMPVRDVIDRYYRLNNGLWIHAMSRRNRYNSIFVGPFFRSLIVSYEHATRFLASLRSYIWQKPESLKKELRRHVYCGRRESIILTKLVDPRYRRSKHFPDDLYSEFHHIDGSPYDYRPQKLLP